MHRLALALLAGVLVVLFAPLVLRDRVVFPHDNTLEAGLLDAEPLGPPSVRRYSDASHYYLPALAQQLGGARAGWISTWDPHTELGKPSVQLYGLGKAFLPTHVLSWFSSDPLRVYTWSAVLAVALASLFGYLLLEALGLHALACLTGALGIGVGSLTMYALCFTLFLWGVCWTTALLWCTTLFVRRPSAWSGLGLAFFTHALLLSAYPQFIVWNGYLLVGYALLGLARHAGGTRAAVRRAALLAGCVFLGAASALPVHLDLIEDARRSTRLAFNPDFFARILPHLDTKAGLGAFVASALDASLLGSPAGPDYPEQAEPFLLPLWSALALAGVLLVERRRLWPILLGAGVALLLTVWPAAYVAAVRTFGLALSRSVPLRLAHVPAIVLAALAVDRCLRGDAPRRRRLAAGLVALAAAGAAIGLAWAKLPIDRTGVWFACLVLAGTLAFLLWPRAWILATLALASGLVHGYELRIARGRAEVALDSPLLREVRAATAGGTRFAWVGANLGDYVAPNQEVLFGLSSIHSYDPLFSLAYQDWAARWRQTQVRGTHDRRFLSVVRVEDFLRESAALAATTVVLSGFPQPSAGLEPLGTFGPIHAYRVTEPPVRELQTAAFAPAEDGGLRLARPLAPLAPPERTLDLDERKTFRLTPATGETLLFVSQQYHPRWQATSAGRPLTTVPVEGVFQGVRVPPGTETVELEFMAAARWSWVPQLAFAAALLGLVARDRLRRARAPATW